MKFFILIFLIFSSLLSFSQGEANNWYFGYNTGISFASGSPVLLNDGAMSTDEGCSSISDASGNLLFYTDGITVYNKNHAVMLNGTGLFGSPSSTQSGVIIKQPGTSSIYYIFTTPAPENGYLNGLRYSEVDMSLDGGNGAITTNKNILLQTPTCEKITGVRHQNNQDIWLVSHDTGSNQFRTFLITSAGINLTPVISSVGEIVIEDPLSFYVAGQLKAYLGGKKIASATYSSNTFELFDFDNSTGVISNPILLTNTASGAYGVEFSSDGSKLYGSIILGTLPGQPLTENLYQWDLCAGSLSANDIINSRKLIYSGSASDQGMGSLQLAPDGKIYVARFNGRPPGDPSNTHYLGVINDPNSSGIACNYVDDGFFLGAMTSGVGLPNFVPYNLDIAPPPILSFSYDPILCANNGLADPVLHTQFAVGGEFSSADPNLIIDAATGQINLNTSSVGIYDVRYNLLISACGIQSYDTIVQVRIEDMNQVSEFSINPSACQNSSDISPVKDPLACVGGQFSSTPGLVISPDSGTIDISASTVGTYVISYTCPANLCGPFSISTENFEILPSSNADFLVDANSLDPFNPLVRTIDFSTNVNLYQWSFGDGTISNDPEPTHIYSQQVVVSYIITLVTTSINGCKDTASMVVNVPELLIYYVPNCFTPNGDERNNVFLPVFTSGYNPQEYVLEIYNRWGQLIFESMDSKVGWDGTYKNLGQVEQGTYTWKITFGLSMNEDKKSITGHVVLIN